MKKLFLALILLSAIPVQAYDWSNLKNDSIKTAKVAGKLGWAAGMTCIGFGLLSSAVNFPENAYYAHNASQKTNLIPGAADLIPLFSIPIILIHLKITKLIH